MAAGVVAAGSPYSGHVLLDFIKYMKNIKKGSRLLVARGLIAAVSDRRDVSRRPCE